MKRLELCFIRAAYDGFNAWTEHKTVTVNVPDELLENINTEFEWRLISGRFREAGGDGRMKILQYITVAIIFIIGLGEVYCFVFNRLMEWLDKKRKSKK